MINKSRVHGYIEVELNKKHGKRILLHENMLTQFGKSVVIGNGLGGIFSAGTDKKLNNIRCIGTREYTYYGTANPVGPYLVNMTDVYTDGSKITNLLLNNPSLSSDTGLYIPDDDTLAGYAALDTSASGTLKEGTVSYVKDAQNRIRRLVRRFEYSPDLACEFNTIAMATMTPTGTTGRVIPMYRNVNPFVYNDSSMQYFTIQNVGLHKIKDSLVSFTAADGATYTVSGITGKIEQTGTVQTGYDKNTIISVFTKGNYTYVVRALPGNYSNQMRIGYDVLDTDGNTVYSTYFSIGDWTTSYYYGMVYYEGDFYFVYGWSGRWYKLTDTGSGYMTFSASTYINAPITLPTKTFSVLGSDSAGFTTYQFGFTFTRGSSPYYFPTSFTPVNSSYEAVGSAVAYTGCLFNIGHQVLSFAYAETKEYDWAPKLESLVEYGNLISYHTLDQTIQKSVGDTMFITYSYVID